MISKMEFDCKIAHQDEIKRLSGFNSIKELYAKINERFSVPINDVSIKSLDSVIDQMKSAANSEFSRS